MLTLFLLVSFTSGAALPAADDYLAGHRAEESGRYADALAAYGKCADKPGPLQGYARTRVALCLERAGRLEQAASEYRRLLSDFPEGPWVKMAQAGLAELNERVGDRLQAGACYERVLDSPFRLWWLERYEWLAAENNLADPSQAYKAHSFFRMVLADPQRRTRKYDAAEYLSASPLPEDRWTAAELMVKSGAVKAAVPVLAGLVGEASEPERRVEWKYLQGRVLLGSGNESEALALLREAAVEEPKSIWGRLARSYVVRTIFTAQREEAERELDRLVQDGAGTEETGDALWWFAGQLFEKGDLAGAARGYGRLADVCPGHDKADDGLMAQGRALRALGRNGDAVTAFEALPVRFPTSRLASEAAYEGGRLREKGGDKAGAVAAYATAASGTGFGNFYGHRALERLCALGESPECADGALRVDGTTMGLGLFKTVGEEPGSVPDSVLSEAARERLRFFGTFGMEEGEWEALYLAERHGKESEATALYRAIADAGMAHTGGQLAQVSLTASGNMVKAGPALWVQYPRPYWNDVQRMARETGLDPYLLLSVARQESTFRPAISSNAGATGVMQLMPSTATWLDKTESGIEPEHAADLTLPANSLRLGAYYLMRMLQKNDGNLVYALASYNGGPGNVRKWCRELETSETEAFIESIPFGETREYVKRVLANYAAYRSIYGRD